MDIDFRPEDQEKRPPSSRKSEHESKERNTEPKHQLPFPTSNTPGNEERKRKRKRSQDDESLSSTASSPREPSRVSPTRSPIEEKEVTPLEYWRKEFRWPKEYFEAENNMLARKISSLSFRRRFSETESAPPSSTTPSNKTAPYQSPQYVLLLEANGSFMRTCELGIADTSKTICQTLLEAEQMVPKDSVFEDDSFKTVCQKIEYRNEARVIHDIARLIVPSPETLAMRGANHLKHLTQSVDEGWDKSIALTKSRPQPDFAVGFDRTAFTEEQLQKLLPSIGGFSDLSLFMGTYYMYFPFLTCEVKCSAASLDVAYRQNAHSMTLAVRGVVALFKLVKRQKELHREILAFSISHNHQIVAIHGHYPVIDGEKTTFYRYPIRSFDFTNEDGKEKWTAYKFTKNIYEIWMPIHLNRIRSAIEELPLLDFEVSEQSEPRDSGMSQGLESYHLSDQANDDAASSSRGSSRDVTPDTSLSGRIGEKASRKPKKRARPTELLVEDETL